MSHPIVAKSSFLARSVSRWRSTRLPGKVAVIVLLLYVFVAIAGPWLAPYDPNKTGVGGFLEGPSKDNLLGTDELGRDQLSRILSAARIAVVVAAEPIFLALVVGGAIGVISGFIGGIVDLVIIRAMDIIFAFPTILLAILLVAVLGPSLNNAMLAIGIVYVPRFARIARSSTLTVRHRPFMEAAQIAGIGPVRRVLRHVVPNILTPLIILAALSMSTAQLTYATLSFLGLGTSPPQADYGSMLSRGSGLLGFAPWLVYFPGIALVLFIVMLNIAGDAVRDSSEPN
jgi:ABC-type dipeptide/oligopeptide/nickel transport system permease subunit